VIAKSIPTSKLARSGKTGAALLKAGSKHLTHAAKRPFLSKPAHQISKENFVESFYVLHALHADPNPGNYLFASDGSLGLIDFGCVRHFSSQFVAMLPKLLKAYMDDDDASSVLAIYKKLGMVGEMDDTEIADFFDSTLRPFGKWITRPFLVEAFEFSSDCAS